MFYVDLSPTHFSNSDMICSIHFSAYGEEQKYPFLQSNILTELDRCMFAFRYGDEEHLVTLVGVMQTLVSFSEVTACGQLNYIKAGRSRIAFLNKDPLILVLISHTDENAICLTQQLTYAYHQIISTLTLSRIKHKFSVQPNFDLRRWLSNAEKKLLHNIIDMYERDLGLVMTCAKCLILPANIRSQIGQTVAQTIRGQKVSAAIFRSALLEGFRSHRI